MLVFCPCPGILTREKRELTSISRPKTDKNKLHPSPSIRTQANMQAHTHTHMEARAMLRGSPPNHDDSSPLTASNLELHDYLVQFERLVSMPVLPRPSVKGGRVVTNLSSYPSVSHR